MVGWSGTVVPPEHAWKHAMTRALFAVVRPLPPDLAPKPYIANLKPDQIMFDHEPRSISSVQPDQE
jgi:hypothetical protein